MSKPHPSTYSNAHYADDVSEKEAKRKAKNEQIRLRRATDPAYRELIRERNAKWRAANPEKVKRFSANWKAANHEKVLAIGRRAEERRRGKRQRDPLKSRAQALVYKYGITAADYERMLTEQGGKCAVCITAFDGTSTRQEYLDHCHVTGRVRGVLCFSCNTGLGHFKDNPDSLSRAIAYLAKHSGQ